ncbi:uncharacterized protein E5676_scaffold1734G00030 [Cucumis melo var. makuwa]|nr:uncharacterized protein E6C27_scaffold110G002400 [Cucumis melo var. makuwa]TYK02659.1 uncharacterized protein E5676_scaffold1734G00030 [Cucumis melo var. makuwa]
MEGYRSIDWNMEELSSGDVPSGKEIPSVLEKGCNVGKKLLIAGLAISSAPVLLPPLVIMSAFGFVASIPYGVFLASYACTETIMSVWLPMPLPPEIDHGDEEIVEENDYKEGIVDEDEKHGMEIIESGAILDDLDNYVAVVQGDEDEPDIGSRDQGTVIEVTNVEFEGNGDIEDKEEQLEETRGLLKRIRDEGRRYDDFTEAYVSVDHVRELEILLEVAKPSDYTENSVRGLLSEVDSDVVHPQVEYGASEVSSKLAQPEEAEQPLSVTMIDVIESEEDLSISAVTIEPKVEANAPRKDDRVSSNEDLASELKIRENIVSMKKIIGYNTTPIGTYIDEVNALYSLVGVEPPTPLKDSSDDDLNLLSQRLQFLMSIVGVK